ncbi:MAG: hypothetical protein J5620_01305 [Alphaproteobacteria bacterium]|nr:hypothetical protein [Alphaproteobacteria bacterium]
MSKYYKIITNNSHFAGEYNIPDVTAVTVGTRFTANNPYDKSVCIKSDVPVIHFSETAFETLMWYEILTKPTDKIAIYEITPIGPVIKQKCDDFRGLTQCGAPTIQIDRQISLEELVHNIKEEFKLKKLKKKNPFPDFHTANIIYRWAKDSQKA